MKKGQIKEFIVKLTSVLLILTLFGSCMTIAPDNRSEAVDELRKLRTSSTSRIPLENATGPVFRISSSSNNASLMIAGQMGVELGYKYFLITDSNTMQSFSGAFYQGSGGFSTSNQFLITVVYTNEESHNEKYNAYECSSLLDGYTFVTQGGRITLWTLFGVSLFGGTIMMSISPLYDSPQFEGMLIGGGALMMGSLLFTIPLW